ncbi:MAG: ABC transporter permease subunit [Rhizobiales bacterium]|jgi:putative spermidine/putrescine transport system permease protein|nr:ABC transporter permease subunit [Hyphomicrobiales bacterium]
MTQADIVFARGPARKGRATGILDRGTWTTLGLLAPAFVFLAIFFIYPVAQLLFLSVRTPAGAFTGQNYARIATDPVFLDVLAITFKISLWTTVISIVGGYPIAYLLANAPEKRRNRLMIWVLLPFWTSFLVRTFAWMILLGKNGAVNKLLMAVGLTDAPLAMIYNLMGTLIGMVHAMMPLAIITMLPVMQKIDPNLMRAADTLGARGGQAFWRIYFPQSMPGVSAAAIMVFISSLGFFIVPSLLGGAHETMLPQVIITQLQELLNWAFAGALAVLLLVAALIVFVLYDRIVGMSTLAGASGETSKKSVSGLAMIGGKTGAWILGGLGNLCALSSSLWETIVPPVARGRTTQIAKWTAFCLIVGFLVLPALFVIPASFTAGNTVDFPPQGFSLKWYEAYLSSPEWISATYNSFFVAIVSGLIALLLGTAAAFGLTRRRIPAATAVLSLVLSPLIIPRIVIAVALFYLYSRIGLVGTLTGLVIGHVVLALPYVVITVFAVLSTYDRRLDQAANTLGANPWRTLWHITLPQIKGGLVAAFLFAFITSFDELTVALFITGGAMTTLPRQIWSDMLLQINPTLAAVATVLLVVMTALLFAGEFFRRPGRAR